MCSSKKYNVKLGPQDSLTHNSRNGYGTESKVGSSLIGIHGILHGRKEWEGSFLTLKEHKNVTTLGGWA